MTFGGDFWFLNECKHRTQHLALFSDIYVESDHGKLEKWKNSLNRLPKMLLHAMTLKKKISKNKLGDVLIDGYVVSFKMHWGWVQKRTEPF